MRLNKFIADAGVCSRRKADEMIKEGRVTVNKQEAVVGMEIIRRETKTWLLHRFFLRFTILKIEYFLSYHYLHYCSYFFLTF